MAQNDLLHVNKRLIAQLDGDAPAYENVSDARLVGAQVWEVLLLLRAGSDEPDVAAFVDTLSQDAKSELAKVLAVYDDPGRGPFKAALARARTTRLTFAAPDGETRTLKPAGRTPRHTRQPRANAAVRAISEPQCPGCMEAAAC